MLLSLFSLAFAAPPDHVDAPGLEQVCESVTDAEDIVFSDAEQSLIEVAELAGLPNPSTGDVRTVITGVGKVALADCSDDATEAYCLATSGSVSVSFAGKTTDFENPAQFVITVGSSVSYSLTPYGDDGSVGETTTYGSKAGFEHAEGTVVIDDGGDLGTVIWPKYGDIIMSSMPLDDFYD